MNVDSAIDPSCCGCASPRRSQDMLSVAQAADLARSLVAPVLDTEAVAIADACGRVAVHDVHAPRPMPFFDQSAMDGFCVRIADLVGQGPWRMPVAATIAAGDRPSRGDWRPGTATRIFTGAPVPAGADAVVMNEDCDDEGGHVRVHRDPRRGDNIRRRGGDVAGGALLVAAGTRIAPRHVGLLAANGLVGLDVRRCPRVGVFSTGRELISAAAPEDGRIFDANRPMLLGLVRSAGADAIDLGVVDDDLPATVRFFSDHAGDFDLLLSSGAVSAGARDFVRTALVEAGGRIHAWKVAVKPGKPALFATLGRTACVGLPGNPLSALVGFELFVRAQLLRLGGASGTTREEVCAVAGYAARRRTGRTEYVPARIVSRTPAGAPVLQPLGNGSSGTLHAACRSDGLAVIPAHRSAVAPGDRLGFLPFCPQRMHAQDGDLA